MTESPELKIALLTDGVFPLSMGGMQKHSAYLLKGLLTAGLQVDLFHPGKESLLPHIDATKQNLIEHRIHFPPSNKMPGSYLKSNYYYSRAILEEIQDLKLDFIYAQGLSAWALLEAKTKGKKLAPIGLNMHGLEMFQMAKGFKQRLIQHMFRSPVRYNVQQADVCYSLGGKLTDILRGMVPEEKISVIPIGVGEDWIRKEAKSFQDQSPLKFLFLGRYERRKGIEEINQVIGQLDDQAFEFEFIGPIPVKKRIKKVNVRYHGAVNNVEALRKLMDKAHVLLVPSYSEGMPTVILEAMSRGLIVIASDVGAVSEQVDASTGYKIQPGDVLGLRRAIEKIAHLDSATLEAMSHKSIEKVRKGFTWEQVLKQTVEDIYQRTGKHADLPA